MGVVSSYTYTYYGEMITYLGMTMPMAVFSLVVWLRHPFKGNRAEVEVRGRLSGKETALMLLLTAGVTAGFWFILSALGTANIIPSTISVTTSFGAVYLTLRRSPHYALWYAANDIVLIVLWVLAMRDNISYISVVVNFSVFLVNDIYGFINWKRMENIQKDSMITG